MSLMTEAVLEETASTSSGFRLWMAWDPFAIVNTLWLAVLDCIYIINVQRIQLLDVLWLQSDVPGPYGLERTLM